MWPNHIVATFTYLCPAMKVFVGNFLALSLMTEAPFCPPFSKPKHEFDEILDMIEDLTK